MKSYVFTGIWSFSCYADSKEEAWEKFNDCDLSEICIYTDGAEAEEIGEDEE